MQTLEVSDAVYNDILSRRVGREAISTTLTREMKKANMYMLDEEARAALHEERGSLSDLKKKYNVD